MSSETRPLIEQASGCERFERIAVAPHRDVFRAVDQQSQDNVRLTVFSAESSAVMRFREAFKGDRERLSHLNHAAVARYLFGNECEGQLLFGQQVPDWRPLSENKRVEHLVADDLVEIGWQLCSALQHAHNLGLFHQGITEHTVLLSNDLRVMLVDFRVAAWLATLEEARESAPAAAQATSVSPSVTPRQAACHDLRALLAVLRNCLDRIVRHTALATTVADESPDAAIERQRRNRLRQLIDTLLEVPETEWTATARDVQGLLGELLLGESRDAMPIEVNRAQGGRMRRSIVDELFDEDAGPPTAADAKPRRVVRYGPILPILAIIVLTVALLWAAGLIG